MVQFQHYIPKRYFRWFSPHPKCIALLRKANGQVVLQASIKKQSARPNFYGDQDLERRITDEENMHMNAVGLVKRVGAPARLDEETRQDVRAALLFQRARTQLERLKAAETIRGMSARVYELGPPAPGFDQELQESIGQRHEFAQQMQISRLANIHVDAIGIGDLEVALLVNGTSRPFVFGDSPVVFYNQYLRAVSEWGVLGYFTHGLQLFFPIGPNDALLLYDAKRYSVSADDRGTVQLQAEEDVEALNRLQLHGASQAVYFGNPDAAHYVQELWESERDALMVPAPTVQSGTGVDAETGRTFDLVHTFERQLPCELSLSFVTYTRAPPDAGYHEHLVRNKEIVKYLRSIGRA